MYWSLRRDQLCDPNLCQDAPADGGRCDHCPLTRLEEAEQSEPGMLLRRALDLMSALKLGVQISLDEIGADEFYAMLHILGERQQLEMEQLSGAPCRAGA